MGEKFLKSVNVWHSYKQERDCLVHFLRLLAVCWPGAQGMVMSLWRRPRFFGPPCISKPFLSSNGFRRFCVHDNYPSKSGAKAPWQTKYFKNIRANFHSHQTRYCNGTGRVQYTVHAPPKRFASDVFRRWRRWLVSIGEKRTPHNSRTSWINSFNFSIHDGPKMLYNFLHATWTAEDKMKRILAKCS